MLKGLIKYLLISSAYLIFCESYANEMPSGGKVQSGEASISGYNTNHLIIEQKSQKSIINWDSFSIHKKGIVDFKQPNSQSFSLNRVTGSTPSNIAGKLNSNGKIMLINPNGIAIVPGAVINTNSFTASTLDIKNKDFLKDNYTFEGNGKSKNVRNGGKITIGGGGHAAFLGGQVSNTGTVTARLGKIFMGSGERITLDFVGDGLMKVTIPPSKLEYIKDINGRTLKSIVSNSGTLKADGGLVQLSTAEASRLSRGSVNIGRSGKVYARSSINEHGRIVIGGSDGQNVTIAGRLDVSSNRNSNKLTRNIGRVEIGGRDVKIDGSIVASNSNAKVEVVASNKLSFNGKIIADGEKVGGDIQLLAKNYTVKAPSSYLSVSGKFKGGRITIKSSDTIDISGGLIASSDSGYGGVIDLTAKNVKLQSTNIDSSGSKKGGLVRIGGELQGGDYKHTGSKIYRDMLKTQNATAELKNADIVEIDKQSEINVSSKNGKGGVAVVWSNKTTKFSGKLVATGNNSTSPTKQLHEVKFNGFDPSEKKQLSVGKDPPNLIVSEPRLAKLNPQIQNNLTKKVKIRNFEVLQRSNTESAKSGLDPPLNVSLTVDSKANTTKQTNELQSALYVEAPPQRYDKGGGFVEISSKEALKITNFENLEVGNGTLLLDPRYIRIQSSDSDAYGVSNGGLYAQNSSGTTILTPGNITSLLNAGTDVTLQAHHTIFVDSAINANSGSSSDLTLQAGFRVDIDANIDLGNGDLTIMTNDLVSNGVNSGLSSNNGTLVANGYTLTANNVTIDNMGRDSHVPTNSFLPAIIAANKITIRGNAAVGRGGTGITHRLYGNLTANGSGNAIEIASARLRRYNNSTLSASSGRWLGWKTTSDVNHLVQENNRQNADFKEFGKTYGSHNPTPASGNGYLFSYNRDLTKTINSATKTYDGTTAITTGTGLSFSSINTYHGDTITLDSPDATFDNKNAGSSKSVTANSAFSATSSLTTGISGTGETTVFGYQVATGAVSSASGVISTKSITLSGDRFYNGTNVVQGSDLTEFTTLISGEALSVTGSGTVSRLVAGVGDQSVSLGSITLQDSGSHLASNYSLSSATYEITQKPVTVSGSKFYDGDNDVLASEVTSIVGTVGSETLTMTGQGTTVNKNVGSGLTVTTGTLALDDGIGAASNYTINGDITFDINKRVLSIEADRPTNGSTTIASSDSELTNLVSGESLNLSGFGVATQSGAGTAISISDVSNFTLADGSGGLASNYTLTGGTHLVDITATSAFISGNRTYDGLLTIDGSILTFTDPNNSSASVTVTGTGSISNADVGAYSINVSSLSLSGTDAGNYNLSTLSSSGNVNVTIQKRSLNLSGNKTYDGTNDITESGLSIGNTISGDTVGITGTALLENAAAGTRNINVDSLSLSGIDANNYSLTDGTHQMTVNPVVLAIHGTKVYDGDTTANVTDSELSIQNLVTVGGVTEGLRFTGTGIAASKDVIPGNTTLSQNTLAIADQTHAASNYTFSGATMTFNITEKAIDTNFARVYDGTNVVNSTNFTSATGLIGSESITMASGSGTVSTSNQNYSGSSVALDSTGSLSLGDGSNGGLAQNYTLSGGSHNLTISQRPLDMTGTKVYDGNTVGEVAELTLTNSSGGSTGLVDGDSDGNFETLTLGGSSVTIGSKDVVNSPTTITNAASRLTKSNGSNGGLANNYTFSGGTHTFSVTTKQVNFSRVYNDLSTVVGSNLNSTLTTSDTVGSETLTMTGTGSVVSQNYSGSSQSVTLGTLTLGNGTNGGLATNYSLSGSTLTINQRPLNLDGSKTYDGNTDATNSLLSLSNLATDSNTGNGETLGLAGTATISSKDAGSRTITNAASSLSLSNGSNGGLANNYTFTGGTHNFTINTRPLTVSGTRQYDGTAVASSTDLSTLSNFVGSETVTLSGNGSVSSANVANNYSVNTSGLSLVNGSNGGLAANYNLTGGSYTLNITKRNLSLDGTRVYDNVSTVQSSELTLSNLVGGENLTLSGNGSIASTNVGANKTVTLGSLSISDGSGGDADNYQLSGGTYHFDITSRPISLSGSRLYDATTNAEASDLSTHGNVVGSQTLSLSGTGTISSKHVGANKTVSAGTLTLGDGSNGGLASNYTLTGATHQLTVNQRPLNATLARQYDATTTSAGSTVSSFDALQGGENLTMTGSGTALSANVSNGISMSNNGDLALANGTGGSAGLASNYSLNSTVINITQRVLNSSGSKVYDANTDAIASAITISNLVGSETLSHSGTASTNSANAGSYSISNLPGISLADGSNGGLASNYTLSTGTHDFTINRRVISVSGTRLYDATTNATASDLSTHSNLVGSQTLGLSGTGTIASKNVGSNKTVSSGTLTLADGSNGGLAANYTLSGGTHQLTVNQRPLIATLSRQYDSTSTAAGSTLSSFNALQGGENLTLTGSGTATSANVANSISMANDGDLALADGSGGSAGRASNYSLNSTLINITQKPVNTSGTRTYDATTTVASEHLNVSGELGGEQLSITGNGSITDKNVGTGKSVNTSGLTLQDGSNGGLAANYTLSGGTHTFNITEAPISFTGSRTYNASTNVEASNITLSGEQGGEDLTVSGNGSITNKDVGGGKTADVSGLTLGNGVSGTAGLSSNYTFTGGTHTFDVTQAPLTVTATKTYDGTVNFDNTLISVSGLQSSETLLVDDDINTNSSNVGSYNTGSGNLLITDINNAKTTFKKVVDHGAGGGNNVSWPGTSDSALLPDSGESEADFIQRALELMNTSGSGIAYMQIAYTDSSKSAISLARAKSDATSVGSNNTSKDIYTIAANENAIEASTGKTAADYNAGFNLTNGSNGGLASNYIITSHNFTINRRVINLSGSRIYDATTNATASDLSTHDNLVGSQTLSLSGTGTVTSKNVSADKIVSIGTLALADGSNGGIAANYTLAGGTHQLTVNQRPLNATLARQYDATTTSAGSTVSGFDALQGGENLTMTGSGTASSANVANSIAMTSNGDLSLADGTGGSAGLASNYSLNSTVINITQRVLNSSGSKVYDANTDAIASSITLSNLAGSETLSHSGTASVSSANAGSYTISNLSGISLSNGTGSASNYTLTAGTHSFTVNRRIISVSGTRLYDATTNATSSDLSTHSNLVSSQTLVLSGTGILANKNAESNKTVSVGSLSLGDGSNGGLASNYTLSGGTHQLTISQRPLVATLLRQYDGTTNAGGSSLSSFNDLQGGENLNLSGSGISTSANVANAISLSSNGDLALADGSGSSAGLASNYSLTSTSINITKRILNSSGSKSYDANTNASSSNLTLSNIVDGESLSHSGTASTSSANASSYTIIDLSGITLSDGTGSASNYTLSGGTHNFTVNKRDLIATISRQYDSTSTALGSDLSSFNDLQNSETLSLSGSGTVISSDVANGLVLNSLGNLALVNGTGIASNYNLNSGILNISKRVLNSSGSKTYDGTTTASSNDIVLLNLAGNETLLQSGDATLSSANASAYSISNLSGISLSNGTGNTSNYTLEGGTHNFTVNRRVINLGGGSRHYDGTTVAIAADLPTMTNLVGAETLSLSGNAVVDNPNVGADKSLVNLSGLTLVDGSNGGLASNYTLTGSSSKISITPRVLSSDGSKTYDGNTNVNASQLSLSNLVGSESLGLSGFGTVTSKNVGSSKTVTLNTLTLSDSTGSASNYTLTGGTHTFDISRRTVTFSGARVYDGSTVVSSSDLTTISNLVTGESLGLSGSGSVSSKDVGSAKSITAGSLALTDANGLASNYTLGSGTFDISQKWATITGTRSYNGNVTVNSSDLTVSSLVSGESLNITGSGTVSTASVGNNKTISLGSLALQSTGSGTASNYTFGSATFEITQRVVGASGSRTYDGSTNVAASDLSLSNLVSSETLSLSGSGSIVNAGVENNKSVSIGSLTIGDGSGAASNYTLSGGSFSISINTRALTASGIRNYNGSTTVDNSDLTSLTNLVSGETLGLSGSGSVSSANVGSAKPVTLGSIALVDGTGSASNYSLSSASLNVTPIQVTLTGSRNYDSTSQVQASDLSLGNLVGSETLNLTGTGSVSSSAVANNYVVSQGSLVLSNGSNGGIASNYTLSGGSKTFSISQRALNLTGSRAYDSSVNAASSDLTLGNLVGSETINLSGTGSVTSAQVGNGKTISLGTLSISDGTGNAANYSLSGGTHELAVTQRSLTLSGTRSYNGTSTVSASDLTTFNNIISGETLGLSGSGTMGSASVGSSKSVSLGTLSLSNGSGSASNYTLSGASIDVTQKQITLSGSKVYDGSTIIQGSDFSTFTNIVSGETLGVSGTGIVASSDIGNSKSVTSVNLQLTDGNASAANYSLSSTITTDITARSLDISGTKVYDGSADAESSNLSLGNLVSGQTITLSGAGTLGSAAVGSQSITGMGTLAISDNSARASNYELSGSLLMTITARPVTVTGSRAYDGTANAEASSFTTFSNLVSGETLSLSGTGQISSANVGSGKTVSHQSLALANGSGAASNYSLGSVVLDVTQRVIDLDGIRAFDGSTSISSSDIQTLGNIVSGETLILSGSGSVSSSNAEMNKSLSIGTLSFGDGNSSASNYTLSGGSHTFDISQLAVNVTGSKTYDGTITVDGSILTLTNLVSNEAVSLTGTGTLDSAAAGANKTVNSGSLALSGSGSENYTLSDYTITFEVLQRPINLTGSRQYDGSANVSNSDLSFSNLVSGETLNLSGSGSMLSAAVGSDKVISADTLSLSNGSGTASNYTLTGGTHRLTVTQRQLTLSGTRVYDGTTDALNTDLTTFSNLVGSETLTVTGTGSVTGASVGSNKNVTLNDLTLVSGTGVSSNYLLSSASLTISQRPISLDGSRTYDGTSSASASDLSTISNLVSGETLSLSGSGSVSSAAVGNDKTVSIASLTLSDGSGESDNYTLNGGTLTLDVTKRNISLNGTRTYDGSNIVSNSNLTTFTNLVSGETLSVTGSGTITSPAVGSNKSVTLGSLGLSNGSGAASNYNLNSATLTVSQRPISLSGSRPYNGLTSITNSDLSTVNIVSGETLSVTGSGTIASADAGNSKTVTLNTLTLGDGTGSVSNYTLTGGSHTVNISKRVINLSGSRVYDGTTEGVASDLTSMNNLVSGETLSLSGTGSLVSASVGEDKTVSIGTLSLSDGSGESDNYTLTSGTHTIDVTKKTLSLSGTRAYNGTIIVNGSDLSNFSGLIGSESLSISGSGSIAIASVGSDKSVSLGNLTLIDGTGAANNYNLSSASLTVNKRVVNLIASRVYDGNTSIQGSIITTIGNLVASESLTTTGTGSVSSANVSDGKSLTLGSITLANGTGSASNYTLTTGSHTANISKRPINLSGSRIYNGNTIVSSSSLDSLGNLVSGETLSISGNGSLSSKDVGNNKVLSPGSLSLSNGSGDIGNYTLSGGSLLFNVTPKPITISGSRSYDGTTVASGDNFNSFLGVVSGDSVDITGTGTFPSAVVGSKNVSIGSLNSGNSNYVLSNASMTVTKRLFNLSGARRPGGSLTVRASELSFSNLVRGESLLLSGVGYINNSRVLGTYDINVGTLSVADSLGLASNYDFGTLIFRISHGSIELRGRAHIMFRLKSMKNINDKLFPSKIRHRSRVGLDRKVTVTAPDQSISISPCAMTDGFCN